MSSQKYAEYPEYVRLKMLAVEAAEKGDIKGADGLISAAERANDQDSLARIERRRAEERGRERER
jgi:hypothetical protein